jgi:hypothetical protein
VPAGSIPYRLSAFASDFVEFIFYHVAVVLCVRVYCLAVREECRLRVFERTSRGRLCRAGGNWRQLGIKRVLDLYCWPDVSRPIE